MRRSDRAAAAGGVHATGDPNEYRSPMQVRADPFAPAATAGAAGVSQKRGPRGRDPDEYRAPAFGGQGEPFSTGTQSSRGPSARRRSRRGADRPLFEGVCAGCGKTASVPFQPKEGRLIYCQDCFQPKKS